MARRNYKVGDWFGVPLREGGYAVGIIARANPRSAVLMGYFFGPKRADVPEISELAPLSPADAVLVCRFGHLGLTQKKWPILGRLDGWDPDDWPMPVFIRYEQLTGRSLHVFYDNDDPTKLIREVRILPGVEEQGPSDRMAGAGYVEIVLTNLFR